MGLMIYSLGDIPREAERDYFIYLLDFGWDEPIRDILIRNYDRMAEIAAGNNAVVIKGIAGAHFQNEVLSWHHINGEYANDLLPALLITNKHPYQFLLLEDSIRYKNQDAIIAHNYDDMKMILIPFKRVCETDDDVIAIIQNVFNDIRQGKDLANFNIVKSQRKGVGSAIVDALILQPNIYGIGVDFKKFFKTK